MLALPLSSMLRPLKTRFSYSLASSESPSIHTDVSTKCLWWSYSLPVIKLRAVCFHHRQEDDIVRAPPRPVSEVAVQTEAVSTKRNTGEG